MIESYEVYPNVIYCAVDERVFRPMRVKKKYQVFYVGSPTVWEDGYDLAKDAIELIPGEIRPELYTVSWKKENGQRLSEKELVRIYSESLVTLCPSRMETFGLVPLESMACGVPVIATKVGGHRETVEDGKTGFLVDFDPREIAEKITLFLRDFKLSREMGMSGREAIIDRWTWRIQIKNLESLLMKYAKKRYEY
jgi:glycosyltransferase involved in cell wall biosynthesis